MSPFPLPLLDLSPEALPSKPEHKPCLMIIQVQIPEQHPLLFKHLTGTVPAIALDMNEGPILKLTICLIDQTLP